MKYIIISALYLVILFCLSVFVFEPVYLYDEIKWLDIPMHILGGFGVASLAAAVLHYKDTKVSYWKLFAVYVVIAIVWELYEYTSDVIKLLEWNGWTDTVADFINGLIGMSIAYLFVKK